MVNNFDLIEINEKKLPKINLNEEQSRRIKIYTKKIEPTHNLNVDSIFIYFLISTYYSNFSV